jgi:hypothetical protein
LDFALPNWRNAAKAQRMAENSLDPKHKLLGFGSRNNGSGC